MELSAFIFLSSGLFLGWSLGANDAANVFGTAVGSRMIRFQTAAVICAVALTLGAVWGGAGAAHGLGKLGDVNTLPGSFMVAFSAALTVYWMTKAGLPVSTSQAIVGGVIGWNLFSGSITDAGTLVRIAMTWVACPILGAVFAAAIYAVAAFLIRTSEMHLLRQDLYTRIGLVLAGAFGAYSLGANNIANVMGVFVSSSPFTAIRGPGGLIFTSSQQLFLLGAVAIAVGVFTYSKRVMMTVGNSLMPLNPVAAWVAVVSHSIVLFLFSSTALERFLVEHGLPAIPLIPVSSSQAVIGAVIGLGLLKGRRGARQIQWRVLVKIGSGWLTTPITAAVLCFVLLFVQQNVFDQQVYRETYFVLSEKVLDRLAKEGVPTSALLEMKDQRIARATQFRKHLRRQASLSPEQEHLVLSLAEIYETHIDPATLMTIEPGILTKDQRQALLALAGQTFEHKWQLINALEEKSPSWRIDEEDQPSHARSAEIKARLALVFRAFHITAVEAEPPATEPPP